METKDGAIAVAPAFPGHQEGNAKIYVYMIKMFKVFQVQACLYIFLDFEWFIVNVLIDLTSWLMVVVAGTAKMVL